MPTPKIRLATAVLTAAVAAPWLTPAYPHAVCGDRIFPDSPAGRSSPNALGIAPGI
ncbi:MAG TPA: hypothetical protein VGL12_00905 [Roseiarcus sp.]